MEILNENIMTAAEARDVLESKDIEQMSYEQKICVDFLKKNIKMSAEDSKKMIEDLKSLDVPEETIPIIINTLPRNIDEIKHIFPKDRLAPNDEDLEKINEIVRKYE